MKSNVSKDMVKGAHSADSYAVDQKHPVEIKMDGSSDYTVIHSTPQITRKHNEIQESGGLTARSGYSIDSGFSDRTFNSTWVSSMKDTPSLSIQSTPELDDDSSRRLTLNTSEFSPINRGHLSHIQGRRLEFSASYLQPTLLQQPQIEPCKKTVVVSEDSVRPDNLDSISLYKAENVPLTKPVTQILNNQSPSRSNSPQSVITDDLEVSLQEMVLEESPVSSRTSPVHFSSAACEINDVNGEKEKLQLFSTSGEDVITFPQCGKYYRHLSDSCLDKLVEKTHLPQASSSYSSSLKSFRSLGLLSTELPHHRANAKLKFLNKLSLTPTSSEESHKQTVATTAAPDWISKTNSGYGLKACENFSNISSTLKSDRQPLFSNFRVPPSPRVHTPSQHMADQCYKYDCPAPYKTDEHKDFASILSINILPRSPLKRSCDCKDRDSLFSPTKIRKMEIISGTLTSDGRISEKTSPKRNATMQIHNEECSPALVNGRNLVSEQVFSTNPYLHTRISKETRGISGPIFDEIEQGFNEKLKNNADYMPHLNSVDNSVHGEKEITPRNHLNLASSIEENLRKMVEKLSPPEPTRLIGRNFGVRKFDIIQELYCQSFQLCVVKIFHYVADTDLISIARVSTIWKLAMYNDHKAYNRYRQHMKNLSRSSAQHGNGKENCREKPVDASSDQSLTQPRGLLSSMQSQAKKKVVSEPPPTVSIRDSLMSDDTLRMCPRCQGPALIKQRQDRAICMSAKCSYDFCTLCFSSFHHPQLCKPLCRAPFRGDIVGSKRSKKNLKRL